MQSRIHEPIAARSSRLALVRVISATLAQVVQRLSEGIPIASDDAAEADLLQPLAEVEGALAHIDLSGPQALIRLLRIQLNMICQTGTSPATLVDLAQHAQYVQHAVVQALDCMISGEEVPAAELLPCWQALSALGGAPDASPAEMLSLKTAIPSLPSLPVVTPPSDPIAEAERALLICLRVDDNEGRISAIQTFANVIAAVAGQALTEREQMCWQIVHAYMLELAQAGGLLVIGDKKILSTTIRALRQRDRNELSRLLEALAREALYGMSMLDLKTDAGIDIARHLRLAEQLGKPTCRGGILIERGTSNRFGSSMVQMIADLETDPTQIHQAMIWQQLADDMSRAVALAPLAEPLLRLAGRVDSMRNEAQRELLVATLLALPSCADAAPADIVRLVEILNLVGDANVTVAGPALVKHVQRVSVCQRLTGLCDTVCAELAAAESLLEVALQQTEEVSSLSVADDLLRQVAGALTLCGLPDYSDDVATLRTLLARQMAAGENAHDISQQLANAWVQLSAALALSPLEFSSTPDDGLTLAIEPGPIKYDGDAHDENLHDADVSVVEAPATEAQERLHGIFLDEVRGHISTLNKLAAQPESDERYAEAIRAVHTIAGCSATIGQASIAALALALETYLMREHQRPEEALLIDTLITLDQMLDQFATRGECDAHPDLLSRLQHHAQAGGSGIDLSLSPSIPMSDVNAEGHEHSTLLQDPARSRDDAAAFDTRLSPMEASSTPTPSSAPLNVPQTVSIATRLSPLTSSPQPAYPDDDASSELLAIFEEEAADLLPQLDLALRAWQEQPDGREPPMQLLRVLHTLKGSARMAGLSALGNEFHQTESDINTLVQQSPMQRLEALSVLQERIDRWMSRGIHDLTLATSVSPLAAGTEMMASVDVCDHHETDDTAGNAETHSTSAIGTDKVPIVTTARSDPAVQQLRVAASQLTRVADTTATLWVGNAAIHDAVQDQRHAVVALADDLARLRTQLRELEIESESRILSSSAQGNDSGFDPLEFDRYTRLHELTRMMAESIADLAGAQRGIARQVERLASSAGTQARDIRQLQLDLQVIRSQPLRSVESRLRALLRQVGRDAGREAELVLVGAELDIERGLLDRLAGPFGHLLRNAVVHGIEPPEQRLAMGKPRAGTVTIGAVIAGNELRLWLQDDGRGLDFDRVRRRAVSAGLLSPDDEADEAALAALIFAPGFSTAAEVTEMSGRGIGMDAVRAELQAMGGRIVVDSLAGQGCRFDITVPLALASVPVLLISAGGRRFALPVARVKQVVQPAPGDIDCTSSVWQLRWQGQQLPLRDLAQVLGTLTGARGDDAMRLPVAILQEGDRLLALQLDAVIGQREVMVKHPGAQLAQVPGIAGATQLGDGSIVLILDPFRLPEATPIVAEPLPEKPLILVVDDSLTVRRASQRLLERHGYSVTLARDGIEALDSLSECTPMAVLLDIEMPRMDGFELLATLRADPRLSTLPVLMITSRIADRHRERAQQLGVLAYLGKPFDEGALLTSLAGLHGGTQLAA